MSYLFYVSALLQPPSSSAAVPSSVIIHSPLLFCFPSFTRKTDEERRRGASGSSSPNFCTRSSSSKTHTPANVEEKEDSGWVTRPLPILGVQGGPTLWLKNCFKKYSTIRGNSCQGYNFFEEETCHNGHELCRNISVLNVVEKLAKDSIERNSYLTILTHLSV